MKEVCHALTERRFTKRCRVGGTRVRRIGISKGFTAEDGVVNGGADEHEADRAARLECVADVRDPLDGQDVFVHAGVQPHAQPTALGQQLRVCPELAGHSRREAQAHPPRFRGVGTPLLPQGRVRTALEGLLVLLYDHTRPDADGHGGWLRDRLCGTS